MGLRSGLSITRNCEILFGNIFFDFVASSFITTEITGPAQQWPLNTSSTLPNHLLWFFEQRFDHRLASSCFEDVCMYSCRCSDVELKIMFFCFFAKLLIFLAKYCFYVEWLAKFHWFLIKKAKRKTTTSARLPTAFPQAAVSACQPGDFDGNHILQPEDIDLSVIRTNVKWMNDMYEKQRKNGGLIDLEEEKNKRLVSSVSKLKFECVFTNRVYTQWKVSVEAIVLLAMLSCYLEQPRKQCEQFCD